MDMQIVDEEPKGETAKAPRYAFVVLTGRHKIIDHHKGAQVATADDEDSARLIVRALNGSEDLVSAIGVEAARQAYHAGLGASEWEAFLWPEARTALASIDTQ